MPSSDAEELSFNDLIPLAERVAARIAKGAVASRIAPATLRKRIAERLDLSEPQAPDAVLSEIEDLLRRFAVQVTHPRYFGLFNPPVLPETVAAVALAAAYNPQEAVWSHSPAAVELEQHALRTMATLIGFDPEDSAAHFTSGGQEANLSAVVTGLAHAFPNWRDQGLRALPAAPVLYVAGEGHHSFVKAARVCGLGDAAVRWVTVDSRLRMDVAALGRAIADDRAAGRAPFLVVGTAGTTAAGAIDPLSAIADVCARERLWLHCDAAWGGGALLSPTLRAHLDGIARADSVTWDAHKWMCAPMGSGAFFCRHPATLTRAFDVASDYMPPSRPGADDPHRVSLQWTRRAIGIPVLTALAVRGVSGYAALVEHQSRMADRLRVLLTEAGYRIVNDTPLPVVCFTHPRLDNGALEAGDVCRAIADSGRAWISPVSLGGPTRALRACITSPATQEPDLCALIEVTTDSLAERSR